MSVINIREARREGARLVVGIAGPSGSGKTCSAIILADGMVNGDASKIGLLDTENKRGSLYADILKDKDGNVRRFLIGDLIPPFTPDRYAQAIKEFEEAGVEVLIIDSITHEWEGTGGCIEIAESFSKPTVGWNKAKTAHKKFMNTLLQCDMHIIACIRAREFISFKDPKNPESLGIKPVQEKNFMFEMTASLMMENEGKDHRTVKCPGDLKHIFEKDGYISFEDGQAIRAWVDGGDKQDRILERWKSRLTVNAEEGLIHTRKCWNQVPEEIRKALGQEFKNMLFNSAESYDTLKKQGEIETGEPGQKPLVLKKQNPLHNTKEWAKYIEAREALPDIAETMQEPTTPEQCLAAVKLINQEADKQAS